MRWIFLLVAVVTALLAAGPADAALPKLPPKPPRLDAKECGVRGGSTRSIWFRAADGKVLAGALYGSGPRGVVLAPQSSGTHCGWVAFARYLAGNGFRVLAFDLRGNGQSPRTSVASSDRYDLDLIGAVKELRRRGARSVVAGGASVGGAAVLAAGPALTSLASGIADFSGEPDIAPQGGAWSVLPRLTLPLLVIGGKEDPQADETTSRKVLEAAGATDKQLLLVDGNWHGWDIVQTAPGAADTRAKVLAWLGAHT